MSDDGASHRGVAWTAIAVGAVLLASSAVTLPRAPLLLKDETFHAAALLSILRGGDGVPTVLPPGTWDTFPRVYGPAYFSAAAPLVRAFGVTPVTVRLPCLLGAIAIAAGAGWLAFAVTRSFAWAAFSFAVIAAAPDLAIVAANGRSDSLAIGAATIGWAALADGTRRSGAASWLLTIAAGIAWSVALLASPRVLPWFGSLALVSAGLLVLPGRARGRPLAAISIAGGLAAFAYLTWTHASGWGVLGRLNYLRHSTEGNWFDVVPPGGHRTWGMYLRPGATFGAMLVTGALTAVHRRSVDAAGTLARLAFWSALATLAYWVLTGNNILFHGAFFTLPLLTASLALARDARFPRVLTIAWGAAAALFLAIAIGKNVEIAQSWTASDPRPLQAFFEREVPAGSIVFGPDDDYFYAVEAAHLSFRTALLEPFPTRAFGQATVPNVFVDTDGRRRFLVWHAGENMPLDVPCALGDPVALFRPAHRSGALARLVRLYAREHGYVDTALYAVPPACGAGQPPRGSER